MTIIFLMSLVVNFNHELELVITSNDYNKKTNIILLNL